MECQNSNGLKVVDLAQKMNKKEFVRLINEQDSLSFKIEDIERVAAQAEEKFRRRRTDVRGNATNLLNVSSIGQKVRTNQSRQIENEQKAIFNTQQSNLDDIYLDAPYSDSEGQGSDPGHLQKKNSSFIVEAYKNNNLSNHPEEN